jgi:hypothetical protein
VTILYRKHANGVGAILKYTLYGNDVDELNDWKEDFLKRYEYGYCAKCSDPILYDYMEEGYPHNEFGKDDVVHNMFAERWTSCD